MTSSFRTLDSILNTIHEMFTDRGYKIIPRSQWNKKNQQFEDLKAIANMQDGTIVFVFFDTEPKVLVKKIREYVAHMEEQKITNAVLVYGTQITSGAKSGIPENYKFETFQATELYKNRTRHYLVPKHEKLTDEQIAEVLKKYCVSSKNQLPRYDPSDMVVRYYNWPVGTVVKIYRRFGNQREPEDYYRHVRP